ncbi:hypothetical protein [Ostreiculturibacter nitratireducens]|uniref:hypothetical protein n=1 Tax=Ostreiculturibacter nitratireducens TaxID=3075226 RepID=UPI0031B61CDA
MRDFFIRSLEMLINVIVVLGAIIVVITAVVVSLGGPMGGQAMGPMGGGGPLAGLLVLIGGGIYLILVGGFMYLGLGIYQNTKRTAEAIEKLEAR